MATFSRSNCTSLITPRSCRPVSIETPKALLVPPDWYISPLVRGMPRAGLFGHHGIIDGDREA